MPLYTKDRKMLSGGGFNLTMKSQNSDHTSFVVQTVQEPRAVLVTHDSYSETRGIFAVCSAGCGDCKGFTIEIPSESMIGKLVLSQHPLI